jgi:hypothetical protein
MADDPQKVPTFDELMAARRKAIGDAGATTRGEREKIDKEFLADLTAQIKNDYDARTQIAIYATTPWLQGQMPPVVAEALERAQTEAIKDAKSGAPRFQGDADQGRRPANPVPMNRDYSLPHGHPDKEGAAPLPANEPAEPTKTEITRDRNRIDAKPEKSQRRLTLERAALLATVIGLPVAIILGLLAIIF